jgi:DNA-directed RNA polymerase specialized sigma subunit
MTNLPNLNKEVQHYIEIDGEQIPVTEEVYRAYKRPLWAEHKRQERIKRCRDENGFSCTKDCHICDKQREGVVLSLECFADEGYEIPDTVDTAELVADKLLLEQLVFALDDLDPEERSLINTLFYNGRAERDYATEIGISHQAVAKRKKKVIKKLRRIMGVK